MHLVAAANPAVLLTVCALTGAAFGVAVGCFALAIGDPSCRGA